MKKQLGKIQSEFKDYQLALYLYSFSFFLEVMLLAENFFSILKSECIHRHKPKTIDQARLLIDDYIHFYNNERIQLKTKLTPLEKRRQLA
ncbi:MAG: IS3 family transposase [Bacillota bacterium]|nr:IS3 family transposase [Bacillota bacterium]